MEEIKLKYCYTQVILWLKFDRRCEYVNTQDGNHIRNTNYSFLSNDQQYGPFNHVQHRNNEHVYNNIKTASIQTRLATYQKCCRVLNFFFNFLAHFSPLLSHYTVHKLYRKDQIGKGTPQSNTLESIYDV